MSYLLSSIYLALQGTYKYRKYRERIARERKLCINLAKEVSKYNPDEDNELCYHIDFLSQQEIEECKENEYWFELKNALKFLFGKSESIVNLLIIGKVISIKAIMIAQNISKAKIFQWGL